MIADTSHRAWEPPRVAWILAMNWHDLLFMHWPMDVASLRPLVPAPLEIDTFDGQAWIGIVPFHMTGVRPRCFPSLPRLSNFAELNVRTYVKTAGKPGVWFFSLDAANPLAVRNARRFFHLPYYNARMSTTTTTAEIQYDSTRTHRRVPVTKFRGRYSPAGPVYRATPGNLDHWLTERYCLYASNGQKLFRGEIHHARWPLQPAKAEVEINTMTEPLGIKLPQTRPVLYFAKRLDVVAWKLEAS